MMIKKIALLFFFCTLASTVVVAPAQTFAQTGGPSETAENHDSDGAPLSTSNRPSVSEALPDTYPVKATPQPTATPLETVAVPPSPSPTAVPATPAPAPKPSSSPKPSPTAASGNDGGDNVSAACKEVYPSKYQDKLRVQCTDGAAQAMKTGWANAASQCRAKHSIGERLQLICQVGASIGDDLHQGKNSYSHHASACRDLFPINSPVDVYFQESCLSGADLRSHTGGRASFGQCRGLSPNDRGFLAPCAAGLSLATEGQSTTAADLNKLCSQYFDKAAFNLGYRSCLNSMSLALEAGDKKFDVVRHCGDVVSDTKSANERASCIVGYELYRYLHKTDQLKARFKSCGETKVTYGERDTLACLTASSLTDFMDHGKARKACKDVFTGRKNKGRADCERLL